MIPCFFQDELGFHLMVNGNGYLLIVLLSKKNCPKLDQILIQVFFFYY
ncbi:unnamed protein product, partial [Staurois parvus]